MGEDMNPGEEGRLKTDVKIEGRVEEKIAKTAQ